LSLALKPAGFTARVQAGREAVVNLVGTSTTSIIPYQPPAWALLTSQLMP
jgi:hypothetical protein